MKTTLLILLIIVQSGILAQVKYNYNSDKLNIPDWLTNPNYISDNEDETTEISIEEKQIITINSYSVVELILNLSEHNHGTTDIYLGVFDKKNNIVDISMVASHSISDWNWTEEAGFDDVNDHIIRYMYIDVHYRPAESEEEQKESGGMVLSSRDTTVYYYKIGRDGSITSADDIEMLDDEEYEEANQAFDEEACILKIRERCTEINTNAASYIRKGKKLGDNCFATFFYEGEELLKVTCKNSKTSTSEEYFYNEGNLMFVFTFNKKKKEENRYYFNEEKMFRWLTGTTKAAVSSTDESFIEKENEILNQSTMFMAD
jgi:hypothetical protein